MEHEPAEKMTVLEKLYTLKVECHIEAMKAENKMREMNGEALAYGEAAFSQMAEEIQQAMEKIADEYKRIARKNKGRHNHENNQADNQ